MNLINSVIIGTKTRKIGLALLSSDVCVLLVGGEICLTAGAPSHLETFDPVDKRRAQACLRVINYDTQGAPE